MNKLFLVLLLIAAIALSIRFYFTETDFAYAGTLEATKIDLSTRLPSTIASVKVKEGDHVQSDQELVALTCEDVTLAAKLADDNYDRTLRLFKAEIGRASCRERVCQYV